MDDENRDGVVAEIVRAAGGVVISLQDGVESTLLVFRQHYDDWTLPKGRIEPNEDEISAAQREVLEETGWECKPVQELAESSYIDHKGRPKVVKYWKMEALANHGFSPNDEITECRWFTLAQALSTLTYERDKEMLRKATEQE